MNQEQILDCLRAYGPMTPRQIHARFEESLDKGSIDHTRRKLRSLYRWGLVKPVGKVDSAGSPPSILWEAVQ